MFILSWFLNKSGQWSVHSNINIQVMKIIVWSSNEYGFIVTINCEFIYESPMLTCCNLLLQFLQQVVARCNFCCATTSGQSAFDFCLTSFVGTSSVHLYNLYNLRLSLGIHLIIMYIVLFLISIFWC